MATTEGQGELFWLFQDHKTLRICKMKSGKMPQAKTPGRTIVGMGRYKTEEAARDVANNFTTAHRLAPAGAVEMVE